MSNKLSIWLIINYISGIIVFIIGVLNLVLVHPVPGIVFLGLSILYIPAVNVAIRKKSGFAISPAATIILGIIIIWFTLSVSDLGDIIDKL